MQIFAISIFILYLGFLIWEKRQNRKARQSFLHVIHVNGTRGKTGTARMIDACLRAGGYRVFTKTTGSDAAWIGTDGVEHRIHRLGPPSVSEQFRILRKAKRENAQIVIIECMAVKPELQKLCQEEIVRGDLNVITNVRYDHLFEMGPELPQIAESLAGTIPQNGVLFTGDKVFYPYFEQRCKELGSACVLCDEEGTAEEENVTIAVRIGKYLGMDETVCRDAVKHAVADYGTRKSYMAYGHSFLNLFPANDPQSTMQLVNKYHANGDAKPVFIYNNREDRPDRVQAFAGYFFSEIPNAEVLVTGQCRTLACRILKKQGIPAEKASVEQVLDRLRTDDLIGIGNIKGCGEKILARLEGVSENE